jgi:hypothetical protein
LGPDATRAQVVAAMQGHVVGKAVTTARFYRWRRRNPLMARPVRALPGGGLPACPSFA